jgi:putative hydrolase of the HAD superfamily
MRFTTLFFDLDDTMYSSKNGLWDAIKERITRYMIERLDIPTSEVADLRRSYYEKYGTTLRGLQQHHQVDGKEFLAYVHDLPLNMYLTPDKDLTNLLERLPQQKWIFTNADAGHARRVLAELQVEEYFDGVVDVISNGYICKPEEQAYQAALNAAGEADPSKCIFLDDSPRNLAPARRLGFCTVLVGGQPAGDSADYCIPSLHDLPHVVPGILEA